MLVAEGITVTTAWFGKASKDFVCNAPVPCPVHTASAINETERSQVASSILEGRWPVSRRRQR